MSRTDKVSDVLTVLTAMRKDFHRYPHSDSTELRKDVINGIAECETRAGRFLDFRSGQRTISDACTRRLRPEITSMGHFDNLADKWLRHKSTDLRDILLRHSNGKAQDLDVSAFFQDGY